MRPTCKSNTATTSVSCSCSLATSITWRLRAVRLRQARRSGVLSAVVIDDLRDFNVLDRRCDAVKVGHLLTKLVGEELKRRLFGIPDVEVVRPPGGLV